MSPPSDRPATPAKGARRDAKDPKDPKDPPAVFEGERDVRLHIAPLSAAVASKPEDLEKYLTRFGTAVGRLSVHGKPTVDTVFAYLTVRITAANLAKLKKALNGVKFKGTVLQISDARPDYRARMAAEIAARQADDAAATAAAAAAATAAAAAPPPFWDGPAGRPSGIAVRTAMPWPLDLVGEHRVVPRDPKKQPVTFRIRAGGRVRPVKGGKKTKLWGVPRRPAPDEPSYSWTYDDESATWRDAAGRTVEAVVRAAAAAPAEPADDLAAKLFGRPEPELDADQRARLDEERRNIKVLEGLLGDMGEIAVVAADAEPAAPALDDDDDDDLADLVPTAPAAADDFDMADAASDSESSEDELFDRKTLKVGGALELAAAKAAAKARAQADAPAPAAPKPASANDEKNSYLKTIFDPAADTGFAFFGADEPEPEAAAAPAPAPAAAPAPPPTNYIQTARKAAGDQPLFFPHPDSAATWPCP
ncbi:uncharacterized protein V1510DRAFT_431816 [Dipodascopsis tothii]|uniref:uncharacterized protein n=1 Tax=Dipodascopsis tothii TaxID=44089 RepID=UPI0034CF5EE2